LLILLVLGLGWRALLAVKRPIAELRTAAAAVGGGDFAARVALRRDDEFGATGRRPPS
jgi:nitrogen fixation/metabolism regulation signal transduction histidine kinase